ncbi:MULTISPECIES: PRC-barrel domain-containing protein [unclassified Halomonas]|uniref:PRC-barrel domain-containing protein n=1 Tax=unclassified Halomonas TaxID=2609666 RepID=UPI00209D5D77|nr:MULTISPECIES: PRC-barrel domain-containing protein [unclassified Halomonas]MCP1312893.1 PRC-barrel domain-containing protein [Halomonas sp. 707D7]MCP1326639.1 PRC-barrel domain-containing protein [Halomonas sp. 707D4]
MKRTTLAVAIAAICGGMSINALAQTSQEGDETTGGSSTEQQETSGAGAQGAQGAQSAQSTEDEDTQDGMQEESADTNSADTDSANVDSSDTDSAGQMDGDQGTNSDDTATSDAVPAEETMDDDTSTGDATGDEASSSSESQGQMDAQQGMNSDDATGEEALPDDDTMTSGADETGNSDGQMGQGNDGRGTNALEDPDNREPDERLADNDTQGGLMSLTISDVEGMTVVNLEGEEIGDVDNVVEHNDSGDLYAVVSVGGFWGFGATDLALPLQEMMLEEDQLVMQTPYGSDEIESAAEEYNEDDYSSIDGSMQVGEVADHPDRSQ